MFVTNWISPTKIQKISEITNFFRHYFLSRTEVYIVKGGSWDSSRDACRSEYSDDVRDASGKYTNVGFRVVRVDL